MEPEKPGFFQRAYENGPFAPVVNAYKDYARHTEENTPKYGPLAGFPALGQTLKDINGGIGEGMVHGAQKTWGAIKSGDFGHALQQAPGMVPLVGPSTVQAGEDLEKGNIPATAGDIAGIGSTLLVPHVAKVAGSPDLIPALKGAATGAAQSFKPIKYGMHNFMIPAPIAGAAAGHFGGGMFGPIGGKIGAAAGFAAPIVNGAIKGAREATARLPLSEVDKPFTYGPPISPRVSLPDQKGIQAEPPSVQKPLTPIKTVMTPSGRYPGPAPQPAPAAQAVMDKLSTLEPVQPKAPIPISKPTPKAESPTAGPIRTAQAPPALAQPKIPTGRANTESPIPIKTPEQLGYKLKGEDATPGAGTDKTADNTNNKAFNLADYAFHNGITNPAVLEPFLEKMGTYGDSGMKSFLSELMEHGNERGNPIGTSGVFREGKHVSGGYTKGIGPDTLNLAKLHLQDMVENQGSIKNPGPIAVSGEEDLTGPLQRSLEALRAKKATR